MALTKSQIFTLIGANMPDNTSGQITPAKLREVVTQIADAPIYAAAGVKEVEVLRSASSIDQAPTALGTPIQLTFGGAQGSVSDPVMLNAAGLVTINQAGNYAVRIRLQCGRTGATGIVTLLYRIVLAGNAYGSPAAVRLDNANSVVPTESREVINATAGQTLVFQLLRDSVGSSINAGGIYAITPATTGWAVAPSALLVISRLEPV